MTSTDSTSTFEDAIDVHVHLMPPQLLEAIRTALHREVGWSFSHPTDRTSIERQLRAAGVSRYFALPYAHKPDMAADLNEWVLAEASRSEMAVPFATVHGDDDVGQVVRTAFDEGARGLKFQCPVQQCGPTDPRLEPAFELAAEYNRPILFHAGTAPHYETSPHVGAGQFEAFLESYPDVRACGTHMGAHEFDAFLSLAREYENAFLDTSFAMSAAAEQYMGVDPRTVPDDAFEELAESIMYGSDYPNIPHRYEAERADLIDRDLTHETYRELFRRSAERFLG